MQLEHKGVVAPVLLEGDALERALDRAAAQLRQEPQAPSRQHADDYDAILLRLLPADASANERGFAVGMTGCGRRSGVTTVASNVAIRAADHRLGPTLVVDANFPRPQLDSLFRLRGAAGLGDVLAGRCELADALHSSKVRGLTVMPIGGRGLVDRAGVDQQLVDALLTELLDQFRVVVFDLPECDQMRPSQLFARRLDAALLVVRSGSLRQKEGRRAMELLEREGLNMVGAVLTQQKNPVPRWLRRWL